MAEDEDSSALVNANNNEEFNKSPVKSPQEAIMTPSQENSEHTSHGGSNHTLEEDTSPRPSSKSTGRIPTISSRAALSRTPGHMLTSNVEGDIQSEQGVLITELQPSDAEEKEEDNDDKASTITTTTTTKTQDGEADEESVVDDDASRGETPVSTATTTDDYQQASTGRLETVEVRVTEDDYDTDLEIEDEPEEEVMKSYYKTCCEQLGLVPVEYFLRHINDQNIRMRYRGLGPDATRAIALALKDNITMERFDIGGNWIGTEGSRYMCRLLEENDYITDVGMSENKMGSQGGVLVAKMININGGLRRLDVAGNEFDDKCAEAFSSALENNKYLRELDLSHNKFTEAGAEFLGPAISANENLDVLDLSWNHLRERGGIAVAKGIKENVRLKSCNLSWNGLDARGGLAITDAMMVNQSLLELDISGNRLTLEVAVKMAKVLTVNDTIKVLKMGNNLITSAGAIALVSAVNNTDSCELEELDLADVPVEYEFLRTVEDIKTNRPNFRVRHGPIMRAGNTIEDLNKPAVDLEMMKKEPVVILKEHIVVNDMRLLDILQRYDEDESLSVTAEDFVKALEELAVPYDKKRLEDSVKKFAATATGKIYFGSFVKDDYNKSKVPAAKDS